MNNLVIAVSPDSSLELLRAFADIIVLDKEQLPSKVGHYDTVYIRSHFSQPSTLPQVYRTEIETLVRQAKEVNPEVVFVDGMDTVDAIVKFEDKWSQYEIFGKYMPRTARYNEGDDVSDFIRPVFKARLSSRGQGVTWNQGEATSESATWIVQETLDIQEELRIFVIHGKAFPLGAIRQSMTAESTAAIMNSRELTRDEIEFAKKVVGAFPSLDIVGLDVARTIDGQLKIMEVNRSPGFAKFYALTSINLANELYADSELLVL